MFRTHQERLPKELALAGITDREVANDYLVNYYRASFNKEFMQPALETGRAFVPWIGGDLNEVLCEQFERTVGNDNCVHFEGMILQIPQDQHRHHYVKTVVRVNRYPDGQLTLFHGPRKLAIYNDQGIEIKQEKQAVALIRRTAKIKS